MNCHYNKILLLTLVLTILTIGNLHAGTYGWQVIDPTSISGTPDFSDVFFVNENTGYISCSSSANIFRTDDGTSNFVTQSTQYATEAIYMTGINTGFAGGANGCL